MRSQLEDMVGEPLASNRLLLIEDNPADAQLVRELLRESGSRDFDLKTYPRLKEGMVVLSDIKFDIVLLDLNLPDSYGIDTFLKLHSAFPRTPIIVLTGSNDERLALHAIQEGAQDYLVKGEISSHGLARSIQYAIERKHSENFMSALDQMAEGTIGRIDQDLLVSKLLGVLVDVLEADVAMILLTRGKRVFARHREAPNQEECTSDQYEFMSELVNRKEPVYIDNARKLKGLSGSLLDLGLDKLLGVPISSGGEQIGSLLVGWSRAHPRDSKELRLLEVAAERFSAAFTNAQYLSEIKELARKLEDERLLLSKVFENSSVGLALVSPDNKLVLANEVWYRSSGYTPETATGRDIGDLFPENRELTVFMHQKARLGERVTVPLHSQRLKGEETWWEGSVTLIDIGGQKETLIVAIDVTERIAYEKERDQLFNQIDAERIRLRTILDTLPVGIVITDAQGQILESNKMRDKIWGGKAPVSKVAGRDLFEAWWAETGMKLEQSPLAKALKHGETIIGEVIDILREDKKMGTVLMSAAPIKDSRGKLMGAVSVIQDTTQQRQLEFDLLEAKSRAELYVDLLTHDVNNFNAAAIGYLQLLEEKAALREKEANWVQRSLDSLEESSRLIDNVRKIQYIESEDERRGIVDLDILLKDVVEKQANPPDRQVEIVISSVGDHFVIGSELLKDVFGNLIENAIKHSSGSVRISVQVTSIFDKGVQYHKVAVEDNGPGIPNEVKGRIFTRLQRGDTKVQGRGLGLYIVHRLVEDFHGRVWVEDRVPGDHTKGARFMVMLPAVAKVLGLENAPSE